MEFSAEGESADALVQIAAWNGYEIDKPQLGFWHRNDLLPTPTVRRLGKGHGTESMYPPGTAQQLLGLCEIYKDHKRTADIGWRLWLRGFPIPMARIRAYVSAHAKRIDQLRGIHPDADELITAAEESRMPGTLGMMRRHVGRKDFPTALRIVLEVAAGEFEGLEDQDDEQIADDALGSTALGGNIGETFAFMSRILKTPLQARVVNATDDDLADAREELRSVLGMLGTFGSAAGPLLGSQGFGLRVLAKAIGSLRPRDEAVFLAMWLAMRAEPEVRDGYAEVITGNKKGWDRAYQASLIIEELRREVPAISDVLSPERMRRGIRDDAHKAAWSAEITAVRKENIEALDMFFEARPDALALISLIEEGPEG